MTTLPLSAVLITLNADLHLDQTLNSLRFCDDIVIVDSGSSDNTLSIAQAHGARVVQKEWMGFGPQKRFAVEQARYDWVLCLDADEAVTPALAASIEQVLTRSTAAFAGYKMARCNFFLGRYLKHGEGYPDWSLRLFNRTQANWNQEPVHEAVEALNTACQFGKLEGDLLHHSAESLSTYLQKQNRYTDLQAQQLAARGKWPSTAKMVLSPWVRFVKFYWIRQGFRDGWPGLVHISIGCWNSFVKYAKTRELMLKKEN